MIRTLIYIVLLTCLGLPHAVQGQDEWQDEWQNVHRIVAIGDLHGDYDRYITLLKLNGLVNERLKWQGGKTHLVQLGDVPDRGPDSRKIIQHLMKLEKQAARKGGYVHSLIGNHEAMNISGDLRYVHPGEYAALVDRKSAKRQAVWLKQVYDFRLAQTPELANQEGIMPALALEFPLGYVEHRRLWLTGQPLAEWVVQHNTVIKINRTLFVHGGLNPHEPPLAIREINDTIRQELTDGSLGEESFSIKETGPLWYRGLAWHKAEQELLPLEKLLAFYDVDQIVVAHTPTKGQIVKRLDGKVILADVGISAAYGGHLANLLILDNQFFSVTPDETLPLGAP
jgi:hypothetical protein